MSISSVSHFTETLPDGVSFDMIQIEGGTFMMGSEDKEAFEREKPIHEVSLDSFYMGQYPVTQQLWEAVMGTNPSCFKGRGRPVEQVSWGACQDFFEKLNKQTGNVYRFPTEAEWEYAARGGQKSQGFTYSGSNKLKEVGWFSTNNHGETKTVGQKMPNELGLYDMSGNVWEWCKDGYSRTYYQECADSGFVVNPLGSSRLGYRVCRGGSWLEMLDSCHVSSRSGRTVVRGSWQPRPRFKDVGFRLAMSLQSVG